MRSIIDEIAAAEAQADELKAKAAAAAKEQVAKAKSDAEDGVVALENAEREKTREALERAEADGDAKARITLDALLSEADGQCASAEKKLDSAVTYLVKKVQELA